MLTRETIPTLYHIYANLWIYWKIQKGNSNHYDFDIVQHWLTVLTHNIKSNFNLFEISKISIIHWSLYILYLKRGLERRIVLINAKILYLYTLAWNRITTSCLLLLRTYRNRSLEWLSDFYYASYWHPTYNNVFF